MRKTGEREYILSPEGVQYMSRVVSLTDMVKRGCREADIEEMRSKLKYEGETTFSFAIFFILAFNFRMENQRVSSKRLVLENVGRRDKETDLRRKTYEWEEGGETLPSGWMKRSGRTQEGQEQERILSPEGEQFRSRFSALQNLVKQEAPRTEIEQMEALLVHEGFQTSNLLPPNWLYKRISESTDSSGRISNSAYIADSGELFDSVKSTIEYLHPFHLKI